MNNNKNVKHFSRWFLFVTFVGLRLMEYAPPPADASWEKPLQPPASGALTALLAHPMDGKIIATSGRQIFSKSGTGAWHSVSHETGASIQKLLYLKEAPHDFFILTQKNISRCNLKASRCSEIYRASGIRGENILSFAIDPEERDHWFLGTEKGLFESDDAGKTWFGFGNLKKPVSLLKFWKGHFFLAAGGTLYESEDRAHFDSIFSLSSSNEDFAAADDGEYFSEDVGEILADFQIYYELLLPDSLPHPFWLATREGVFESRDEGKTWKALSQSGLRSVEVRHLAWSSKTGKLFAGTSKGIYAWLGEQKKWQELYQGLENDDIRGLALLKGENETLLALSRVGFFSTVIHPDNIRISTPDSNILPDQKSLFEELLRLEPNANEIQKAAVRYANVKNGKIQRWHTASRMAAFLPSFSFGKDFSKSPSIDIDRGSTTEKDVYINGPDTVRNAWDMGVTWDLGDFFYSSAQTSIDSREKSMVELRNDILAEITRVFYERRRLELEILFTPAESESEHLEKLLRLDELASLLDGMTNGYFSKRLEKLYKDRPDLKSLWNYSVQEQKHE